MKIIVMFILVMNVSVVFATSAVKETTFYLDCVNLQSDDPGPSSCGESKPEHIPYGLTAKLELTIPTSGDAEYYLYNPNNTSEYEKGDMIPVVSGDYTKMTIKPNTGDCSGEEIGTFELDSGAFWDWELTDGTGDYGTCVVTDSVTRAK